MELQEVQEVLIQRRTLEIATNQALQELLPLFNVSQEEAGQWKKPEIIRRLDRENPIYRYHPLDCPFYDFLNKAWYFPLFFPEIDREGTDGFQRTINHEVSHYIHAQISTEVMNGVDIWMKTKQLPEGQYEWRETVAEYPNFVLGKPPPDCLYKSSKIYGMTRRLYERHGAQFLPAYARMELCPAREVIREVMENTLVAQKAL